MFYFAEQRRLWPRGEITGQSEPEKEEKSDGKLTFLYWFYYLLELIKAKRAATI